MVAPKVVSQILSRDPPGGKYDAGPASTFAALYLTSDGAFKIGRRKHRADTIEEIRTRGSMTDGPGGTTIEENMTAFESYSDVFTTLGIPIPRARLWKTASFDDDFLPDLVAGRGAVCCIVYTAIDHYNHHDISGQRCWDGRHGVMVCNYHEISGVPWVTLVDPLADGRYSSGGKCTPNHPGHVKKGPTDIPLSVLRTAMTDYAGADKATAYTFKISDGGDPGGGGDHGGDGGHDYPEDTDGTGPIILYVNHEPMTIDQGMEWSMQTEEILGGTGRATLIVQDRTMEWEPECHWDVKVVIRESGFVLFRGEIVSEPEELPVAFPWRKWNLDCSDYNNELPQRLVGALDGKTWISVDQYGDYVNVDPFANSLDTDKKTVKQLLDHYVRVDDGTAISTDTFVAKYLKDFATIYWTYTTVQGALEDLAGNIAKNLQFWIDPDLEFHWVAIPAWYDLAQSAGESLAALEDAPSITRMAPELSAKHLRLAPTNLGNGGSGFTRMREIKFTLDGTAMPEQLYVRGSTGYVYNTPLQDTPDPIHKPPKGGSDAKYTLTFEESTKIWHKLDTGYLSASFDTASAGGPYHVRYIFVPWDASIHKGGHFWKLLDGPDKGKLVDNDTNFFKYGKISVKKVHVKTPPPEKKQKDPPPFDESLVGVGGSGWVNEVDQDNSKRQAYLEAPISSTQVIRDAVGGQVLYRSSFPTLRGSCKVSGVDGWRVGQLAVIADDRLPTDLMNRYVVIQRVATSLIEGTDVREYVLDWGDGPTSRWTMQAKKPKGKDDQFDPAIQIDIKAFDLAPGPGKSQQIVGQLINGQGGPWKIPGKVVEWTLEVYDQYGSKIEGQGTLDPVVSVTDSKGKARTTLTTGTQAKLVYFVFAEVPTTPKKPKSGGGD